MGQKSIKGIKWYFGAPKFNDPDGDFSANYQDRSYMMTNLTLKF